MLSIEPNKNLLYFNSFGFNAVAEYYLKVTSESQIIGAMKHVKEQGLNFQVLSGGSNLLIAEKVPGLTLHMQLSGITVVDESDQSITLEVAAGENWHSLVEHCVSNNWQGIENLALIPGLVGASPVQNIGAYGVELKDVLVKVKAFDCQHNRYVELANEECQFSYRDSLFKQSKGRYIITAVTLQLSKKPQVNIGYQALQDYIDRQSLLTVGLKDVFDAVCAVRSSKLPDPKIICNAGSFFKNPCIAKTHFETLKSTFDNIVGFVISDTEVKLAAGWLIDQCGWKGFSQGGVGVYEKQALVLIHTGGASIDELMSLANDIRESVLAKFSVELEIEPQAFPLRIDA